MRGKYFKNVLWYEAEKDSVVMIITEGKGFEGSKVTISVCFKR